MAVAVRSTGGALSFATSDELVAGAGDGVGAGSDGVAASPPVALGGAGKVVVAVSASGVASRAARPPTPCAGKTAGAPPALPNAGAPAAASISRCG